eukprot:COSAG06_NODE_7652_length_2428_cov_1.281237_2_plen_45_part_00
MSEIYLHFEIDTDMNIPMMRSRYFERVAALNSKYMPAAVWVDVW